jgi:cell wall-associated NlpC family hydrolase
MACGSRCPRPRLSSPTPRPPGYFGSEVVARFLGLRYDHPAGTDQLELFPDDPITRAEAAWSLAQVVGFGDWNVAYARTTLSQFQLPQLTADQNQALRIALSRIGYPYVYGGTTEDRSDGLAHGALIAQGTPGGCTKCQGCPGVCRFTARTAAQQAGEIHRRQRLQVDQLKPGDLLFFGSAQFNSNATEQNIIREGIYLGDNWVIHCSA